MEWNLKDAPGGYSVIARRVEGLLRRGARGHRVGLKCFLQGVLQLLPAIRSTGTIRGGRGKKGGCGKGEGSPEVLNHGHVQDLRGKHLPVTGPIGS